MTDDFDSDQVTTTRRMTWRERRAFRSQLRAEARAEAKAANVSRKAARTYAKFGAFREATQHLHSAAQYDTAAASRVLDGVRDVRDRRFRYVAAVGTWLVVLIVALTCMCCTTAPRGVARPQSTQIDTTVVITTWCVDDTALPALGVGKLTGSGVIVGRSTVLTADHVVDCEGTPIALRVTATDGTTYTANVERRYKSADVAVLTVDGAFNVEPSTIGAKPRKDENVCASLAFPERAYKCGSVTGYGKLPGDMGMTIVIVRGNSGSGVYDRTGKLVAIVTHLIPCVPDLGELGIEFLGTCGGRATALRGVL